jgi:hypothetical protein
MHGEQRRILKEVVVAYFKVVSQNLHGELGYETLNSLSQDSQ